MTPFDFSWKLAPGESFQSPEAVLVRSSEGLGGMSRIYHKLYRTRLCRGAFRDSARPILINNWEATYFNFNADKIKEIAAAGADLGIELFVLDDGWFGKRDNDDSSLGDWVTDESKLPEGLGKLGEDINALDMQFGLWFEPEMVSPISELYRKHPDWCLHVIIWKVPSTTYILGILILICGMLLLIIKSKFLKRQIELIKKKNEEFNKNHESETLNKNENIEMRE
ncbi:hypothetical protein VN24_16635 [Paenibacillus beijingensis]|uniref:Alpha-galactosidase n=1 Tax=Paenibacillus beijingensis TaxID=1126833 RepID=A0A0D5NKU5_9BACL|nr:hypothetical protein VN24_16635 [Paenibacillus beijingensis]